MRHGGRARSVLRDALYNGRTNRGAIEVRLVSKPLEDSTGLARLQAEERALQAQARSAGDLSWGGGSLAALAARGGSSGERVEAKASLPLLSFMPSAELDETAESWMLLQTAAREPLVEVRLEVLGAQMLRRLRVANRLRKSEEFTVRSGSESAVADRRRELLGEEAVEQPDIVDQLRDRIVAAAATRCDQAGSLNLPAFFSNPGLTELLLLLPKLGNATELSFAFCMCLDEPSVLKQTMQASQSPRPPRHR